MRSYCQHTERLNTHSYSILRPHIIIEFSDQAAPTIPISFITTYQKRLGKLCVKMAPNHVNACDFCWSVKYLHLTKTIDCAVWNVPTTLSAANMPTKILLILLILSYFSTSPLCRLCTGISTNRDLTFPHILILQSLAIKKIFSVSFFYNLI